MPKLKINFSIRYIQASVIITSILVLSGCAQQNIVSYIVPKELSKDNISNAVEKKVPEKKYHPEKYEYTIDESHTHSPKKIQKKQDSQYHTHDYKEIESSQKDLKDHDCEDCDDKTKSSELKEQTY